MNYNNKGFTLVELMVTLSMTGIIIAAVYSTYTLQQKTYIAQDQVVEMQQNNRVAIYHMVQEIRMAGYDPMGSGDPTIKIAQADLLYFTTDLNEDGVVDDTAEHIAFDHYTDNDNGKLTSKLGITRDNSDITIVGSNATGHQPMAENIQAIEFLYNLENGIRTSSPSNAQLDDIRSVTISILARAGIRDAKFINTTTYTTGSGATWGPDNDNFRRRLLITTVQCRNMGI